MAKDLNTSPRNDQSILVVGSDGLIGSSLVTAFEREGKGVWGSTRKQANVTERNVFLDLAEPLGDSTLLLTTIKTAILCAAVTSMERCRLEPITTRRINVDNTVALAQRFVDAGIFVIFLSSNAVFDGEEAFQKVTDPTNPQTEYGCQKAQAEEQLLAMGERVAVVRFSKIIPPDMPLLKNWASDLKAGRTIHPFSDSVIAPIALSFAVDLLCRMATRQLAGITQASASNDISYEYAARYVAEKLSADVNLIEPMSYRQAGIPFSPKHTTLESSRLVELGLEAPLPECALDQLHLKYG